MPSLKVKRPVLPSHVNLFAVPPGAKRAGQAGAYAPADANVTIHFEGVDSSFFDVIKIETFDLEPVSGGELPPGHTGPPPLELVAALSIDGPGPISVSVDQAVIAVVGFSAPASPTKAAYSATCVMVGDGWSQPVSFAVAASVEAVRVDLLASNITIIQGGRASLPGTITWLAGPETDVDFLDFAVVDFGIRAESLSVPVLPNQSTPIPFTITLTATTDAPPGTHELFGLEFSAFHGDQTGNFDHRVTVTTLVPAARRLAQVTGTDDFISAGVRGVDMGPSVTHLGTHYVFFGDVPLSGRAEGEGPIQDADAVAWVRDFSPNGISLEVVRSGQYFAPFTIRKQDGFQLTPATKQTPTGAFSDDGFAYVFFLLNENPEDPNWVAPVSYLTRCADPASGQPYDEVFRWSESKFWQVAPKVVDNSSVPGLPSASGRGVVLLGGGDAEPGRGAIHLAWMPLEPDRPPHVSDICYHRGEAGWSTPGDQASATPIWWLLPGFTSISLTFVPGAQRWLALYSTTSENRPLGAVVARSAPAPMGPWSGEIPVFDPARDGAFGTFMHWPDLDDLDQRDPSGFHDGDRGNAYGAFILEPLTEWHPEDESVTLHYLMSTWRPYQVQHMLSRFQLG